MATSPQSTFVDDTDAGIKYLGHWDTLTVTSANNSFLPTPLYGTVHALDAHSSGNISYTFQGTDLSAQFAGSYLTETILCQIDGRTETISVNAGVTYCTTNVTLGSGSHELLIQITEGSNVDNAAVYFDRLFITQDGPPTGDVCFSGGNDLAVVLDQESGGTVVDFNFTGYSMSLYLEFSAPNSKDLAAGQLNVSYTMNDQEPLQFTLNNPTSSINEVVFGQLVIQTPRTSLGEHHFHMVYSDSIEDMGVGLDMIIVQNTTSSAGLGLEVIPPVPSVSSLAPAPTNSATIQPTSSNQPRHHGTSTRLGIIVGFSASAVVMLALLIAGFYWLCRHRRRVQEYSPQQFDIFQDNSTPSFLVRPFFLHSHRLLSLQYTASEKPSSKAQIPRQLDNTPRPESVSAARPRANSQENLIAPRPRVRIHQDSGEAIAQPDQDGDEETVDLPPIYDTIGRPIFDTSPPTQIEQQALS